MIGLTRTDGEHCRLDPGSVQRVEGHPTTIVHLTDGAKYAVLESVDDVVQAVRDHHAAVLSAANRLIGGPDTRGRRPHMTPVPGEA
jgi:flagellar protein FlbD